MYPIDSAIARTRWRISGWTPGYSRSERETVPGETFSALAMARIVVRLALAMRLQDTHWRRGKRRLLRNGAYEALAEARGSVCSTTMGATAAAASARNRAPRAMRQTK